MPDAPLSETKCELRKALVSLGAEVSGMLGIAEAELRAAAGNTNVNCLMRRVEEAATAMAAPCPCEGLREEIEGAENAIRQCASLKDWGPGTLEHHASRVTFLCNNYDANVHTIGLLAAERDQLRADCEKHLRCNANQAEIIQRLRVENERLRSAVLNQAGDNLCWLKEEDLGKIPTKAEFLQSCERYHAQIAAERGELSGGRTIAQLEAECERLRAELAEALEALKPFARYIIDPELAGAEFLRAAAALAKHAEVKPC